MSAEYDRRTAIVGNLRTDHKAKEIMEWIKYHKTMVQMHMVPQTTRTILGQNAKLTRSALAAPRRLHFSPRLSRRTNKSIRRIAKEMATRRRKIGYIVTEKMKYITYVLVLERELNSRTYNTKVALKAAIRDAMTNMDRSTITKACSSFQFRKKKVVAIKGVHIE